MRLNGFLFRHLFFRLGRSSSPFNVHLGPGQRNYLDGWFNIDANMFTAKCDLWADLRNPLPFPDCSVDAFYSHHVVEHLPNIERHFREIYRCLKPGGVCRIGGPNGDSAIRKFNEKDLQWFSDFPDKRQSIGGRLENFIFCRNEHLTLLTQSYLEELMSGSGFVGIKVCKPVKETNYPKIFATCLEKEWESDLAVPHTLIVEAERAV